jgi:hypothetical protein
MERTMARKIVVTVLVIVAIIAIYYWYEQRSDANRMGSGSVYSNDSASNTDLDGRPVVGPTPSRSDAPGTINTTPVPGSVSNQPPASMKAPIAGGPAAGPVPVSDTIAPNAPNGLAFGGTGKYQWYRQGNLTWRVDTATGSNCIAFATMEEWRKPIVSSHGCGNS